MPTAPCTPVLQLEITLALDACETLIRMIDEELQEHRLGVVHVLAQRLAVNARVIQRATAAEEPRP